jgi:hypothetical protein
MKLSKVSMIPNPIDIAVAVIWNSTASVQWIWRT